MIGFLVECNLFGVFSRVQVSKTNLLLKCGKQAPSIMEQTGGLFKRLSQFSVLNYSKICVDKLICLVCLLLISVPLGVLSRYAT